MVLQGLALRNTTSLRSLGDFLVKGCKEEDHSLPVAYHFAYCYLPESSGDDSISLLLGGISFFLLESPDVDIAMTNGLGFDDRIKKWRRTLLLRDFIVAQHHAADFYSPARIEDAMWTWLSSGEALLALQMAEGAARRRESPSTRLESTMTNNHSGGAGVEEEIVVLCDFRCAPSSQSFFLQQVSCT